MADPALGAEQLVCGEFVFAECWSFPDVEALLGNHSAQSSAMCEWPALLIPWGTARSNAASEVCSGCGGACTGCCGQALQVVLLVGGAVLLNAGVFQMWRRYLVTTAH